jgi:hypothetical protein
MTKEQAVRHIESASHLLAAASHMIMSDTDVKPILGQKRWKRFVSEGIELARAAYDGLAE